MAKIWRVSATDVKNSWGRVVKRVLKRREPALVLTKGVATVVILPADDYERLATEKATKVLKRQQLSLLDKAEMLAKEVALRHAGKSTPDSAEILRQLREERDGELLGLR